MISPIRWQGTVSCSSIDAVPVQEMERPYDLAGRWPGHHARGQRAPAIGVTAAFGVVLAARNKARPATDGLMADLEEAIKGLEATRPTAVNLFWALERMRRVALAHRQLPVPGAPRRLLAEAQAILDEDVAANRAGGPRRDARARAGAHSHHCNAALLATAGYGTAGA